MTFAEHFKDWCKRHPDKVKALQDLAEKGKEALNRAKKEKPNE